MTQLKTLIVDDEPLAVERMQILCARLPGVQLVGTAADGEAALRLIEALQPDLVFLDIAMPGMTGIDVANMLEGRTNAPAIVFVTAFDQYAIAAFDAAAVDYLLKPVAPERLEKAVARVAERARMAAEAPADAPPAASARYAQEFWVPNRGELARVAVSDIERIEAERDYMRLHAGSRSWLIHETIGALEARLDPAQFLRLHRSTIVRRDRIMRLAHDGQGNWTAELASGQQLRIGRTYLASVRASVTRG
ncbi:response regulator transcription factor [Sandaracinobacter neustonicus]|uniref:Response regulator transcription factor n=1 Tax=Sandaracinobacter neustonicus TaxID=1715348 RepID=A0A501XM96_9SPHN|nr:LytTR family DNA-binding domain-containing protein [Sandaracinobacter neustonicus]TPE61812.1 response regulator transcription factor [Sandaracinobacter neustonicus]